MLKPHKLCNVCKFIKEHDQGKKLLKAIYDSKAFNKSSTVSLQQLYDTYSAQGAYFSYGGLRLHCKKHQFMSDDHYQQSHLRQIAKQAEKQVLKRNLEAASVWDKVIDQGLEKLESGELVMKTADLLKAAKDKSDYELKTKDQQLAYAEMMYHFASGESENNLRKPYERTRIVEGEAVEHQDPTTGATEDSSGGEDGPGGVYYPTTWDAPTFGPSQVS